MFPNLQSLCEGRFVPETSNPRDCWQNRRLTSCDQVFFCPPDGSCSRLGRDLALAPPELLSWVTPRPVGFLLRYMWLILLSTISKQYRNINYFQTCNGFFEFYIWSWPHINVHASCRWLSQWFSQTSPSVQTALASSYRSHRQPGGTLSGGFHLYCWPVGPGQHSWGAASTHTGQTHGQCFFHC